MKYWEFSISTTPILPNYYARVENNCILSKHTEKQIKLVPTI